MIMGDVRKGPQRATIGQPDKQRDNQTSKGTTRQAKGQPVKRRDNQTTGTREKAAPCGSRGGAVEQGLLPGTFQCRFEDMLLGATKISTGQRPDDGTASEAFAFSSFFFQRRKITNATTHYKRLLPPSGTLSRTRDFLGQCTRNWVTQRAVYCDEVLTESPEVGLKLQWGRRRKC